MCVRNSAYIWSLAAADDEEAAAFLWFPMFNQLLLHMACKCDKVKYTRNVRENAQSMLKVVIKL